QIEARRHPVIEEAGVGHLTFVVVEVLLVQRPAYALDAATLHLTFDIAWMNRGAHILYGRVMEDRDLAGFRIDFDIGDVRGEAAADARGIDAGAADDGPARGVQLAGQLDERHALGFIAGANQRGIFIGDGFGLHVPDLRRAGDQLAFDVLRGFIS